LCSSGKAANNVDWEVKEKERVSIKYYLLSPEMCSLEKVPNTCVAVLNTPVERTEINTDGKCLSL
jgi:hypothetical protein